MACFAREGFHATSMQKICAEAGMSPGAFYRYFRSKEELIAAIVADERSARQHLLDELAQAPSVLDALTDCMRLMLNEPSLPTVQLGPEIMADAALAILTTTDASLNGRCLLDEDFLRERGVTDFARYAHDPANTGEFFPDLFIDP